MKLYGFPPTRTIRALWMLRELDLDFEYVQVDPTKGEHRRPQFLAVNPAGKLPVLVDDDFVLTESVAIVLYLAEKYPQKGFLPADLRARAEVYRWLLFTARARRWKRACRLTFVSFGSLKKRSARRISKKLFPKQRRTCASRPGPGR